MSIAERGQIAPTGTDFALDRPHGSGDLAGVWPVSVVGGLPIAAVDRARSADDLIALAVDRRDSGRLPLYVTSANGQVVVLADRDAQFRSRLLMADAIHADGMPMVLLSRLFCRRALPERVATTDFVHDVFSRSGPHAVRHYLLGATADVIAAAAANLRALYPDVEIVGARHGYISPEAEAEVCAEVAALKPDFLWIGMGVPREQDFISRNLSRLAGVGVIKTAGGLFDFLSGRKPRAPGWMQTLGLEWLWRALLEPRRLGWRYLDTNPAALLLIITRNR
ncbi:WecB/TagA/CpsF family glycosyltransferase [Mongoliimonas terrestris]|uniref:WecB/TagA/CpsF family glycosyltransferase n=1 Tax=Mongoliimonas terrestris TaxID=1709001 RepID=UPI0009F9DDB5|nr:WecB/TagA/CpsF family glycosyltransferase [Mongoliimonas terrestris]